MCLTHNFAEDAMAIPTGIGFVIVSRTRILIDGP